MTTFLSFSALATVFATALLFLAPALAHNLICHPLLALTGFLGVGEGWAVGLHDWTAARAYSDLATDDEAKADVWIALHDAEAKAEEAGFASLADAINTLGVLWAAGFDEDARAALEVMAAPLLAELAQEATQEVSAMVAKGEAIVAGLVKVAMAEELFYEDDGELNLGELHGERQCPKPCSECADQDHHWTPTSADDVTDDPHGVLLYDEEHGTAHALGFLACKHCPAWREFGNLYT